MITNLAELESTIRRLEPWSKTAERELSALRLALLRIAESLPADTREEVQKILATESTDGAKNSA